MVWLYDNVNVALRVSEQRLDNQNQFESGTALTVIFLPEEARKLMKRKELDAKRREGSKIKPNLSRYLGHSHLAPTKPFLIHHLLDILLSSPAFENYKERDADCLKAPPPISKIERAGSDSDIKVFMLRTVKIDEKDYEGNEKIIPGEFMKQLDLWLERWIKKFAEEGLIPVIGDQLTIERLMGIYKSHAEDPNGLDRRDAFLFIFGWFHLKMTFALSLHRQFLGTTSGFGLAHVFSRLGRKGLQDPATKGPFHHHLHEALIHSLHAHVLCAFLEVSGKEKLEDLASATPELGRTSLCRVWINRSFTRRRQRPGLQSSGDVHSRHPLLCRVILGNAEWRCGTDRTAPPPPAISI